MALEFEQEAHGFDLDNAYWFAKACDLATIADTNTRLGIARDELSLNADSLSFFDVVDPEGIADYHGYVASNDDIALLVFRDAGNLDPWLTDAATQQKPALGGMVHKGFADALEMIWDEVEPRLQEQLKGKDLWITGHGLGGALAVLAAARLHEGDKPVKAVYNFGSPRVGNVDFYASYAVPTYRIVNNNDIVAYVPAELFPVGGYHYVSYKHVGTLAYLDRHGKLGEGTSNWNRKKELVKEQLLRQGQPPTSWFQDHLLVNYVAALEKNL